MDGDGSRRRFRLSDGLILIAGLAVGLGMEKAYFPRGILRPGRTWRSTRRGFPPYLVHLHRPIVIVLWSLPVPAALTLAVLAARLMPPRPSRRRFASQPGASACLVVAIGVVLTLLGRLAFEGLLWLWPSSLPVPRDFHSHARILPMVLLPLGFGPMILGLWINLWLGRRWRPERSWVDRAGRALGIFWMLWSVAHLWLLVVEL